MMGDQRNSRFGGTSFQDQSSFAVYSPAHSTTANINIMESSHPNSSNVNHNSNQISYDVPQMCLRDLDDQVNLETNCPDLATYLGASSNGIATCSGFSEQDYPSTSPMEATLLNPHITTQNLKMPAELADQITRTQCFSSVGILPSLNDRAYLIVDSDLYLWRIKTSDDIAYYDQMSESILSVSVVKPKPGLFKPHIHHLQCAQVFLSPIFKAMNQFFN